MDLIETIKKQARGRVHALPEPLEVALLNLWTEIKIAWTARGSASKFQSLRGKQGLRVHLGCGDDIKPGWVNIDLVPRLSVGSNNIVHEDTLIICYDLRLGLPLEENSCDLIYSSHFLEHLEYRYGVKLMRESFRVLRGGGIFRAALPTFKRTFESYVRNDYQYFAPLNIHQLLPEVEPGTESLVDLINYTVYQYGEHKCIYDEEKIILILRKIGFRSVVAAPYQEGLDPSSEIRRRYSFYVQAVK